MKKKLHELIEMAEAGISFQAEYLSKQDNLAKISNDNVLAYEFPAEYIVNDWTVRMKREPRVLWVYEDRLNRNSIGEFSVSYSNPNTGKPIKFIEVIESE